MKPIKGSKMTSYGLDHLHQTGSRIQTAFKKLCHCWWTWPLTSSWQSLQWVELYIHAIYTHSERGA